MHKCSQKVRNQPTEESKSSRSAQMVVAQYKQDLQASGSARDVHNMYSLKDVLWQLMLLQDGGCIQDQKLVKQPKLYSSSAGIV